MSEYPKLLLDDDRNVIDKDMRDLLDISRKINAGVVDVEELGGALVQKTFGTEETE